MEIRQPFPPFNFNSAIQKVRLAEDARNTRDPEIVQRVYDQDTDWRNRVEFLNGRDALKAMLRQKWGRELEYRLVKELWAYTGNRIAVRVCYEWHDDSGQWFRSHGNENWEFSDHGLMVSRHASVNDQPIASDDRKFYWALGRRPDDHPSLSDMLL